MSGEIDIMEFRGNQQLYLKGTNIGSEQVGSTLHFGPDGKHDSWRMAHKTLNAHRKGYGFDKAFHKYQMAWSPDNITFSVDDNELLVVQPGKGFWEKGRFDQITPRVRNLWENATIMAPFDQEFYIIMNVAVGGMTFFDGHNVNSRGKKPWKNWFKGQKAMESFWKGRDQWLPTWIDRASALVVDYVRVWAI